MERRLAFYSLLRCFSRGRKYQEEFDELRFGEDDTNDDAVAILSQAMIELVDSNKSRKHPRLPNKDSDELKMFWTNGYLHWSDEEFKERLVNQTSDESNRVRRTD